MNDREERVEAGLALKAAMEDALTAKQMSVSALAREADVQRGDIYKWWRGEIESRIRVAFREELRAALDELRESE